MTARKNSYLALRRRMLRVVANLEYWAALDHSNLPPIAADKMASLQRGYGYAARRIRENL